MTRSPKLDETLQQPTASADGSVVPPAVSAKAGMPPSPARSDRSTDSEGKPVREKLKDTRIDAHSSSDPVGTDVHMNDGQNGTHPAASLPGDQSASSSESERGRLPRRKRSRENFEEGQEAPEKHERHVRKKSRDVTSPRPDSDSIAKAAKPVSQIEENETDETMVSMDESARAQNSTSNRPATPDHSASDKNMTETISPKNKRSADQADIGTTPTVDQVMKPSKETTASTEVERNPKRPREKGDINQDSEANINIPKTPLGKGFASASRASPFASMANPTSSTTENRTDDPPQASDEKFKSSGFNKFAKSSSSPFGTLSNSDTNSPFASATGSSKLSSFASPTKPSSTASSSFGALGANSSGLAFGGSAATSTAPKSAFGGVSGSGFGSLGGAKPSISSFATPGAKEITGLSGKPAKSFGAPEESESEDEDGDEDEGSTSDEPEKEKRISDQDKRFQPQDVETGEEGEITVWTGRAKLYIMDHGKKQWQERGVGAIKFNVTAEEPKRARFILRADGTHRLLLNVAIPKHLKIGEANGEKPKGNQIWFNTPLPDGKTEMHCLKMKPESAKNLYYAVTDVQREQL
ncbi:hypothetical protein CC78DRAFT_349716 [Lojkania enalia]|uniref:RanBD1 domain-containing protein n=1 Tax=Lojkania enalia TaxID=147567 RepID=A0A9P4N778_9PLEO|nr:hypothetical protein CC78DRAFT_349716 [Didymosphaeria enalia]